MSLFGQSLISYITEYLPAAIPGVAAVGLSLYNWFLMRRGANLKLDIFVTYGLYSPTPREGPPTTHFYFPILVNNVGTKPGMINEIKISCTGIDGEKLLNLNKRVEIQKELGQDPSNYTINDFMEVVPQFPISVPAQEGTMFLLKCSDVYNDVIPLDEDITFKIMLTYGKKGTSTIEFPFKLSSIDRKLAIKSVKWIPAYSSPPDPTSDAYLLKELLKEAGLEQHYARILHDAYFDPAVCFKRKKIAILRLDELKIRKLPDNIGQFSELRELGLRDANLEHLPSSIGNLKKLKILDLHKNLLTTVLESIGGLTELRTLRLDKNQLINLPESIGSLLNLQELFIYGNKLTRLPESIGSLSNLVTLYAEENSLIDLPLSIYSLGNLRRLWLSNNALSKISTEIGKYRNLEYLNLGKNAQLTALPTTIGNLTNLKGLEIKDTAINAIPESFYSLRNNFFMGYTHQNFNDETNEKLKNWGSDLEKQGYQVQIASMTLSKPQ